MIDTLIHEDGAAQMEINLLHGDALDRSPTRRSCSSAPRARRRCATRCTRRSWPKPMAREPGSAMHIHQSIVDSEDGAEHLQRHADGTPTALFFSHIAGLQKYLPAAMSLFAPNVNSYRRITRYHSAPINVQWGYDNRTAGSARADVERGGAPRRESRSAARTPIRTSRSPRRSPAAISAWSRA